MALKFGSFDNLCSGEEVLRFKSLDSSHQNRSSSSHKRKTYYSFKCSEIVWRNIILLSILHILALYGCCLSVTAEQLNWKTVVLANIFGTFTSSLGIIAGAHRLWSHRSYKARWLLRLLLAFANTMAFQTDIYEWSRDHRVHHKFSETNADPHNANRGVFFSHIGWLLLKKHKDVKEKGKSVDLSDVWADPIVRFQRRFYIPLTILVWGIIPTLIPYYLWNETLWHSFLLCVCFRYIYVVHCTGLVNSYAHIYGNRPYDKNIGPSENNSAIYFSLGEGYHNYHHTFPWDYSASELGWKDNFNLATLFIDFFQWCGLAYDLKKPSDSVVKGRSVRTGDGTDKSNRLGTATDWIIGIGISFSQILILLMLRIVYRTVFLK